MINNKKTQLLFGYTYDNVKYTCKRIVVACDYCGEDYTLTKLKLDRSRLNSLINKDACKLCRLIKREECNDLKKLKLNEINGILPHQKVCCTCHLTLDKSKFNKQKSRKDGLQTSCKECRKKYDKANQDLIKLKREEYYLNNPGKREAIKAKSNSRISCKIVTSLRRRVGAIVKSKNIKKSNTTLELLGCSQDSFLKHLQSKFNDEMNWGNYGKVWNIDHIIPCAAFDLRLPEEQRKCFHYTNLQPLLVLENLIKNSRLPNGEIARYCF